VATTELIRKLLKTGKKIAIPLVDIRHHVLKHFYTHDLDLLRKGAFGIPEPDPSLCEPARIADLPFIVVPGVAFDRSGNRLGSGHGYYDRFLAQSSGLRVGLAFGMQIIDDVPAANYDQKMDFVVTEDEIISCATRQKA
jgi:5-formyltetrahydrofolate cyclo-ligase